MKIIILFIFISPFYLFAQIPNEYYDNAEGLTGENLRTALYNIIDNHHVQSYTDLWTDMQSTDKKTNGKVWDMYSTKADGTAAYEYTFVTNQCGNVSSSEGFCYNREHSFPKSWFNDASPMYTDLFHLYPTDGQVNGRRSNYPYGETDSPTWTSTNGSKRGTCSYQGYSGYIFEPIDAFKGDFARTYFYMMTRYKNNVDDWSSAMLSGDNLSSWATSMLIEWSELDPVSQKEIDRNNAVHDIQYNRNPFIDHPEYICKIWTGCTSGIDNAKNENTFKIYPNPTKNILNVDFIGKGTVAYIYNIVGVKVIETQISSNKTKIDIQQLSKGVYFIEINVLNKKITKKFIVL